MPTPLILVTNDDGVAAPGLRAILDAVHGLGDVLVSAPDGERSGSSHAMTFHSMLRAHEVEPGRWAVSGTPVDCVYFGLMHISERPPDLVVSGVNSGYNLGTDVFYSGTVGGAAEAFLRGASAMAVSVERGVDARWARRCVRSLAQALLARHDTPLLLNVNVPHVPGLENAPAERIDTESSRQSVMLTRLGRRSYRDAVDRRTDPLGRPYYWIGGPPGELRGRLGDDTWAVAEGLCSVTPLRLDLTDPDPRAAQALLDRAADQSGGLRIVSPSAYDVDATPNSEP
ncbi:5'/3'-nucleotidase SurE [Paraliomyxa miuraensis]|uniref:5'/3'-nucleotidase SurE n=1 Tax=Paraliomyxa miuraensis TaxID=376150 RepID=UPI00224CC367|nr:5'/3'-nucleotidase SurE [Paraliomyxa miuraensis]MCX4244534.1 5'/3'-nucleotidase SurE [Paraliomyxa miuraensis]